MDTRILTTFPTEGQPSPRITPWSHLRNFDVREVPGLSGAAATKLNRWWCCRCVEAGYEDLIGIANNSTDPCWKENCRHAKCHNCLASPNHNIQEAVRTFGGLHASPRFIDPVYWECPCGEWAANRFSEAHATMGMSLCASQTCEFRYRSPQTSTLQPDSIVLNGYGQRLGTADQTIAVQGGPWHWQRKGLGDGANALLEAFRRMLPPISTASLVSTVESCNIIWKEGEPAPRYPFRPAPPTLAPGMSVVKTNNKRSNSMDGPPDDENSESAYKTAYLAGIRRDPVISICDSGGSGGGVVRGGNDMGGRSTSGLGIMSPPTGLTGGIRPPPARSHFSGGPTVGSADHVQIQMQMHMGLPTTTMATTQAQAATAFFTRW
ncbi:hypothetical protein QBC37DRAFT_319188 [Rhypophila decipiens]|uniref:Uncharacterized protein n=1 Tax=Rhypophila decipiens TaxID=261697 RepID=A0AAN6Y9H0_9PEZI|nr:hypothetical protein QBC37DRAFT_319188 [Rhypophila decipiens]